MSVLEQDTIFVEPPKLDPTEPPKRLDVPPSVLLAPEISTIFPPELEFDEPTVIVIEHQALASLDPALINTSPPVTPDPVLIDPAGAIILPLEPIFPDPTSTHIEPLLPDDEDPVTKISVPLLPFAESPIFHDDVATFTACSCMNL